MVALGLLALVFVAGNIEQTASSFAQAVALHSACADSMPKVITQRDSDDVIKYSVVGKKDLGASD